MSAWRSGGVGPEKTSAGLRGVGLIAIVIAFLAVSNDYVSGGDEDAKSTDPRTAGKPTVVAPEALRPILPRVTGSGAIYIYGTPPKIRAMIEDNDQADVFLTTVPDDAAALATYSRCSDAIDVAVLDRQTIVACLPTNVDADAKAGLAYLEQLTGLEGRAALIDAGLDLPDR